MEEVVLIDDEVPPTYPLGQKFPHKASVHGTFGEMVISCTTAEIAKAITSNKQPVDTATKCRIWPTRVDLMLL